MPDILDSSSAVISLMSIASSKLGQCKSLDFFKDNYEKFFTKYKNDFSMRILIKFTTENFATDEKAEDIEAFFATKNTDGLERTVQQSLETIRNNAAWLRRDGDLIKRYLLNMNL